MEIINRKAKYAYQFVQTLIAGMQLTGTEIKSLRAGKASLAESFCLFKKNELWVKGMHIAEYTQGSHNNHEVYRLRKLLLNKRELEKLQQKTKEKGMTIVPYKIFFSERGLAKMEIALAKGKKIHDKRESIKQKDSKRALDRVMKENR